MEQLRKTERGKALYRQRKETIERVFADAKEKHAMRYTHHRGLARVANWVRLKETLIKSRRTSWRHIFPLISSQNLEIHKVFLRFFDFIRRKICSPIRTPFFIHRFLKYAAMNLKKLANWSLNNSFFPTICLHFRPYMGKTICLA